MLILQVLSSSFAKLFSSLTKAVYNAQRRHPARGMAGSVFRPLPNIPYCCLPQESGPYLSTSVGDLPLRTPNHRCLGKPLPYQLANGTHVHLYPHKCFKYTPMPKRNLMRYQLSFRKVIPLIQVGYIRVTHPCAGDIATPLTCMYQACRQRSS